MRNWFQRIRGAVRTKTPIGPPSSQVPTPPPEPFRGRLNFYDVKGKPAVFDAADVAWPDLKLITYSEKGDK